MGELRDCGLCDQSTVAGNRAYCDTHLCMWKFTSGRRCWYQVVNGGYCPTHIRVAARRGWRYLDAI